MQELSADRAALMLRHLRLSARGGAAPADGPPDDQHGYLQYRYGRQQGPGGARRRRVVPQPAADGAGVGEKMAQIAMPLPDRGPQAAVDASRSLVQLDAAAKRQRDAEHPVVAAVGVVEAAGLLGRRGADQRSARRGEERPDRVAQREQARADARAGAANRGGHRCRIRGSSSTMPAAAATRRGVTARGAPAGSEACPAGIRSSASQNITYGVVTRARPKLRAAPSVSLPGVRITSASSSCGQAFLGGVVHHDVSGPAGPGRGGCPRPRQAPGRRTAPRRGRRS